MKKAIISLAVITTGIALLFAQTPAEPAPEAAVKATAFNAVAEVVQPSALGVEVAIEEEAFSSNEGLGEDEITMSVEVGEDALIEEGRISLRLKDAELKDVIRMFCALSGANIIVPDMGEEEVVKKIDVNLDNVEWQPALEAILDTHELELYEKIPASQVFSIRKKTPGAPEALDVKVFKLNYASVNSVTGIVAGLVGATGSYSVFPERNVVVVQGAAKALQRVGLIMQQVDLPRQQVFIEAKFMELSDTASEKLGIDWQVLGGYGIGASGMGGTYSYMDSKTDGINNSFSSGGNRYADIAGRSYEKLDVAPEGEWVEDPNNPGDYDFEFDSGIDYDPRPANFGDTDRIFGIVPTTLSESLDTVTSVDNALVARTLGATLSAADFGVVLSALEQQDGIEIVSNPKIIVANEEEASIHIGDVEPNVVIEERAGTTDSPGTKTSIKIDGYFEDGVKVVVKPTINTTSNITVRITPEITTFIGRKVINSSTTGQKLIDYPISRTKKVDTVFSLESGQTAAIGGLTQTKESLSENKIPFLGDLPFVGRFFSYKQTLLDQNETIIFVTVSLANPSSIDEETGLPTRARLAQRYTIREAAELRIAKEEAALLKTKENMALQKELQKLREANRKLTEKQAATETKAAEKLEAEDVKAAEKEANLSAIALAKEEAIAKEKAKADAAAAAEAVDLPEGEVIVPVVAPVDAPAEEPVADPSTNFSSDLPSIVQGIPVEEPVIEKTPSIQKIIESLEPATN